MHAVALIYTTRWLSAGCCVRCCVIPVGITLTVRNTWFPDTTQTLMYVSTKSNRIQFDSEKNESFRFKSVLNIYTCLRNQTNMNRCYCRVSVKLDKPLDNRPDYCCRFLAQIILSEQNIAVKIHKTSSLD